MKDYFIKLPNKLFYVKEGKTIIQECEYDFKVVEILSYLYTNTNRKNITMFTLENMIIRCGYKLNNHKGKVNDQFKAILNKLKELDIIVSELDFLTIKPTEFIECEINLFETDIDEKNKEQRDIKFVQIFDSEKDKIYNSELAEKVDKLKLYTYYCYIKSRIFKKNSQVVCSGGKAEVCYPSFECIKADLGIQDTVIKKYNDILQELGMIKIANAGLFYYATDKHKKARESCNIYALGNHEVTDMNLKYALRAYREDGEEKRVFIKDYKNNNKKINGYIARITQLEKEGKATQEQINKKNEYLESVNLTDRKAEIQNLLENNEGVLLSTIYMEANRDRYEEKYIDIEEKLGLLNSNWELREEITWEYYCWIITNYTEDKHDFYVNCVAKKIREYSKVDKVVEGVKKVKLDAQAEAKRLFG